jgi:hypothetical protein
MSLCEFCNRTFGSERALKQHEEDSPKHAVSNRPFDSYNGLKQHEEKLPKPAETFGCKACNRFFGSLDALGQHQDNSSAHRKLRKDSLASSVTPVPFAPYVPLLFSASSNARSTIRTGQRSGHATTENTSQPSSAFDLPFAVLESRMQTLTIPDVITTVAPPQTNRAHIYAQQEETRTSFTFPELHQRIAEAVAAEITSAWYNYDMEAHFEDKHTTCVMGKFTCENRACRQSGWSSKVVSIRIRGYPRSGYNAVVYNQRCKSCNRLGRFKLDEESYVERIAYRLKKWAGVTVERPPFSEKNDGPHDSERCEGCKVDDCIWAMKSL